MAPKKITEFTALVAPASTDVVPIVDMSGVPTTKKSTLAQIATALAITPAAHKTSHQDGGSDEISVTGLSGLLGDAQTPLAHNVLSASHGDALAASVVRGDIIIGNSTPKWSRKAVGTGVLVADGTDVTGWSQAPTLTTPSMTTPIISTLLNLTAGQIKFPATQIASGDANTLDDYEEGTWTPVLAGSGGTSGQTYVAQNGFYVKIGSIVWVSWRIQLSAKGTITGNCQIEGQPFANGSGTQQISTQLVRFATLAANWIHIHTLMTSGSSVMVLNGNTAAAANNTTALVTADIADNTVLSGVMIYTVSF